MFFRSFEVDGVDQERTINMSDTIDVPALAAALPKVELHLHLDGSLIELPGLSGNSLEK